MPPYDWKTLHIQPQEEKINVNTASGGGRNINTSSGGGRNKNNASGGGRIMNTASGGRRTGIQPQEEKGT